MWAVVKASTFGASSGLGYCRAQTGLSVGGAVLAISVARDYRPAAHNNPCVDALETDKAITHGLIGALARR